MNKKVVIIGGSSGMGLAAAVQMSQLGYEVVIASRSKEKLDQAIKTIGKGESHVLDILEEGDVIRFFSHLGPFDHLVISAADFIMGPFLELSIQEARRFFDSKFWGQYCVAKYGAPKIRKGGSITFFSGIASQRPPLNLAAASSINGAIESLTRALALELAPLRVNAIAPGTVATPIWDSVPEKERLARFKSVGEKLLVGRVGQPEDIAEVVRFLIECGYMTGQVIYCDGGQSLS